MSETDTSAQAAPETAGVVTKGEFALLVNVSKSRVSQWLAAGKIGPEALRGSGSRAKIHVATAKAQLRRNLDFGQRLGNGLGTRLESEEGVADATGGSPSSSVLENQIKRGRLQEIEYRNRRNAEEELMRRGVYIRTDEVQPAMMRLATDLMNIFDGALTEFSSAIAAKWMLPQRDVLHLIRSEFATIRVKAHEALKDRAKEFPPFKDDEQVAPGGGDV